MRWRRWLLLLVTAGFTGCDSPPANFALDLVYFDKREKQESAEVSFEQKKDVADVLTALFGTPDAPVLPGGDSTISDVIDINNLTLAAGPVGTDENGRVHGLFRQHCVHCHGISGDGKGPTALYLNPYPRDYRRGVFKFKSTERVVAPDARGPQTRAD